MLFYDNLISSLYILDTLYMDYSIISLITILLGGSSLFCLQFFFFFRLRKIIKESIEPKFLDIAISPESQKLISLAIDVWRLEWKIYNSGMPKDWVELEKIKTSLERLKKFTNDYGISIKDFIWEKYVNEINFLELKWTEDTADSAKDWIIKDTIEPVVYINWTVVKTAKVIVYKFIA